MKFTPTLEQLNIVRAAVETKDNLLISALAGAAKSSTLELIGQALPRANAIALAFNKKIAEEMKPKLPAGYQVKTLNSLGHQVWGQTIGKKLHLDDDKIFTIFSKIVAELPSPEQTELWESWPDLQRAIKLLKSAGYIPNEIAARERCQPLVSDEIMPGLLDEKFSKFELDLIRRVSTQSAEMALKGTIDFADQLLMPTCFRATFPTFGLVLVDEAQDLSELNHVMLTKLLRDRSRLIAVGDQRQAIYAFRGAHESGMELMRHKFSMTELTLSCSFRCPAAIFEHVRWRAPHMTHWEGNLHGGQITRLDSWTLADLPDGAAVICRNNAPLFSLAMAMFRAGRYPLLWGNDLAKPMISVLKKLGPPKMVQSQALSALADYHEKQKLRVKSHSILADKIACIEVFLRAAPDLRGAIDFAETIFRSKGKVNLLTGHKSKGHEWPDVFFLDEELVQNEGQDLNLRYVICTRSQSHLTYINSKERQLAA